MLPENIPYLIGETAFHHQGEMNFVLELIQHANELKLNAIKFHLLQDLDDYMVAHHKAIEVLRPWCFNASQWDEILTTVAQTDLDIILLCNDAASLDWVLQCQFPIKAIELHATGLNDYFLLEKAAQFKGTVILGVGGSTVEEIKYAIDYLRANGQEDIFLMHGFQNYPTDYKDINLSKMQKLSHLFGLPIGYADHTDPSDPANETISVLAAAMGFNVLEKHFTHEFGKKRIDAQAAVSLEQMKNIKELLEKAVLAYGNNSLEMSKAEKKYGETGPMKKAIVARVEIQKGEQLSLDKIAFKRTNAPTYMKQHQLFSIMGLTVSRAIKKDELIDFSNVDFQFQLADFSHFHHK